MIKYVSGNLVTSDCDVIIHGCNCFHTMGGGIAREISDTYPEAYEADKKTAYRDRRKLGTISYCRTINKNFPEKPLYIINAYTQYDFGRREGSVYVDYDAVRSSLEKVNDMFSPKVFGETFKIGLPKIGAGLAQGDWNILEKIVNEAFSGRTVYVYQLDTMRELNTKVNIKNSLSEYNNTLKEIL